MDEESKQYTAFTLGSMGLYECESMPFGLCNAPPTFQRLMQNCLGELNLTYCLIYLDDVIVFSKTPEEHLRRMRVVFDHLREHGLKLKPSKCDVFKSEINYLAHHVSQKGVLPSKKNLESIAQCPPPDTYTKVKSFVGLVGHYRCFIKGFAKISALSEVKVSYLLGRMSSSVTPLGRTASRGGMLPSFSSVAHFFGGDERGLLSSKGRFWFQAGSTFGVEAA